MNEEYLMLEANKIFGENCTHLAVLVVKNTCYSQRRIITEEINQKAKRENPNPPEFRYLEAIQKENLVDWLAQKNGRALIVSETQC